MMSASKRTELAGSTTWRRAMLMRGRRTECDALPPGQLHGRRRSRSRSGHRPVSISTKDATPGRLRYGGCTTRRLYAENLVPYGYRRRPGYGPIAWAQAGRLLGSPKPFTIQDDAVAR